MCVVILGDMLRGRMGESSNLWGEMDGMRSTGLGAGKQVDEDDGEIGGCERFVKQVVVETNDVWLDASSATTTADPL